MYQSASPIPPHYNGEMQGMSMDPRYPPGQYPQQQQQQQWGYDYSQQAYGQGPGAPPGPGGPGGPGGRYNIPPTPPPGGPPTGGYNPNAANSAYNRGAATMNRAPSPARGAMGAGFNAPTPTSAMGSIGMASLGAAGNAALAGATPSNASSTGLIRLTLRKPMGIVFEPMTDPHNPSQQRGVRICDLPRTGAAALSQKLEVGDELLSINDKTMSRLTFDEIMDFIIDADAERVDLLFRRPKKERLLEGMKGGGNASTTIAGGVPSSEGPTSPQNGRLMANNSNSVKWIDEDKGKEGREPEREKERDRERERRDNGRDGRDNRDHDNRDRDRKRDDPSVDDTYTVESQSQYTMETYDDKYYRDRDSHRDRDRDRDRDDRDGRDGRDRSSKRNDKKKNRGNNKADATESSFLDMLIDTLCTSVIGRDPSGMCQDRSGVGSMDGGLNLNGLGLGKKGSRDRGDREDARDNDRDHGRDGRKKYDDDDDFTADDGTYQTYEESEVSRGNARRKGGNDEASLVTEEDGTLVTEDDGTRTLETYEESYKKPEEKIKNKSSKEEDYKEHGGKHGKKGQNYESSYPEESGRGGHAGHGGQLDPPDPPTKHPSNSMHPHGNHSSHPNQQHSNHRHNNPSPAGMEEQESAIASSALPFKELEYDDRIDYAADVSVMESLGGPSLLVERARQERLDGRGGGGGGGGGGYDHGGNQNQNHLNFPPDPDSNPNHLNHSDPNHNHTDDPELAQLLQTHGQSFLPSPGLTPLQTALRDPYKFYEHAVCELLRENEPEKVRLLSKLMAKYRGRERHLIYKLSARYEKEGKGGGKGAESGEGGSATASGTGANGDGIEGPANEGMEGRVRSDISKGMEKIHEGGEDDEASSSLNDPSRANMAAIESAKKRLESESGEIMGSSSKVSNASNGGNVGNKGSFGSHRMGSKSKSAEEEEDDHNGHSGRSIKDSNSKDKDKAAASADGWPPAMSDPWGTGQLEKENENQGQEMEPMEDNDGFREHNDHNEGSHKNHSQGAGQSNQSHKSSHSHSQPQEDETSYSTSSSYSSSIDGTSPAVIAQVSELLNYVYGKTSVAGQIDRVSTIMRAYEGREAVLLELLETKALIKANADGGGELPSSIRNRDGNSAMSGVSGGTGNTGTTGNDASAGGMGPSSPTSRTGPTSPTSDKSQNHSNSAPQAKRTNNIPPQTPISVLSDPTMAPGKSPMSIDYPAQINSPTSVSIPGKVVHSNNPSHNTHISSVSSPSEMTNNTMTTEKKKKKGLFGGFFGSKKNKNKDKGSSNASVSTAGAGGKVPSGKKRGQMLHTVDDRSI